MKKSTIQNIIKDIMWSEHDKDPSKPILYPKYVIYGKNKEIFINSLDYKIEYVDEYVKGTHRKTKQEVFLKYSSIIKISELKFFEEYSTIIKTMDVVQPQQYQKIILDTPFEFEVYSESTDELKIYCGDEFLGTFEFVDGVAQGTLTISNGYGKNRLLFVSGNYMDSVIVYVFATNVVKGVPPLIMENAKADNLIYCIAYGGTELSGTPSPDNPVQIKCNNGYIGSDGNIVNQTIETIKINTRNLFDYRDITNRSSSGVHITVGEDGWITANGLSSETYYTAFNYRLSNPLTEGTYTLSINNNKTAVSSLVGLFVGGAVSNRNVTFNNIDNYNTITIPSGSVCSTVTIRIKEADNVRFRIQIERGSKRTPYVPFNNSSTATAEYLLKTDEYTDEQDILNGLITRKCGILILRGTENWSISGRGINARLIPRGTPKSSICSHFKYNSEATTIAQMNYNEFIFNASPSDGRISLRAEFFTDLTAAKTWLSDQYNAGTPVIIIYPLVEPTTEQVSPQPMSTVEGDNTLEIQQASLSNLEVEAEYVIAND